MIEDVVELFIFILDFDMIWKEIFNIMYDFLTANRADFSQK